MSFRHGARQGLTENFEGLAIIRKCFFLGSLRHFLICFDLRDPALRSSRRVTKASCTRIISAKEYPDITDGAAALVRAREASLGAGLVEKCLTFRLALLQLRLSGRTISIQTRRQLLLHQEPAIHENRRKLSGAGSGLLRCCWRHCDREPQSRTDSRRQERETAGGQRGGSGS